MIRNQAKMKKNNFFGNTFATIFVLLTKQTKFIMKKISLVLIGVLSMQLASAQGSKVASASFYMTDYNNEKNVEYLGKAKDFINQAAEHETTIAQGKTWYYRGLVYSLLAKDEATKNDGSDYIGEAVKSFDKALTIEDKKFRDDSKVITQLKDLAAESFNGAIELQKSQNFKMAYDAYQRVADINKVLVKNKSELQFDVNLATKNGTYAAEDGGMIKEAIAGYNTLIENDPKDTYYFALANLYKKQGEEDMFVKTLDRGNEAFPDNANIIIAQLNFLRSTGKTAEAMSKIDKAIELQPENEVLYFVKAKTLDDAGEADAAIKVYEEAIAVNPDYTDAIYNIGAIYFLQGNPIVEKMNTLTTSPADTKIYNGLVEERKAIYRKAKVYFERVLAIKADDVNAAATIKKIDRVLGM